MSRITVIGGTGYTGSAIAREAAQRGHQVISYSRTAPAAGDSVADVTYRTGSMLDASVRAAAMAGTDAVVSALSPRGELDGRIDEVDRELAALAGENGVRIAIIGGFSALRPSEGAPRFAEGDDLPPQFAGEARQMAAIADELLEAPESIDWLYVSPAAQFGSHVPGEAMGRYRVGGDVALFDAEGGSAISGADFAKAIVDELEAPANRRTQIGIVY